VYSTGNLKECEPLAKIFGKSPALGMIFQDKLNVIFLFPLKILG